MSKSGRGLPGLFRQVIVMWGVAGGLLSGSPLIAVAQTTTTAWSSGTFNVDTPNVVRRSNIILQSPNLLAASSMPLGNGSMGAAVWAASGFTAQLNRDDTFPDRKSPGQVTIPGLSALTGAPNFTAYLDLYNGVLVESGGGMTATIYVRATTDELVVDVTGADPSSTQTVQGYLWDPRSPTATTSGNIATLSETWQDNELGATGTTFGSLLAITAGGRSISSSVVSPHTVQLQFNPNADGSFRVVIGAPTWTGGDAITTAVSLFGSDATVASATLAASHLTWWHNYWSSSALPLQMSSADGTAQYLENLRTIYLYQEASDNRGAYPGNHAGNADLFNYAEDAIEWHASEYWFWNMRMHISANLSSGIASLNTAYFNLYTNNLGNIEAFTAANVANSAGACVPEVMRYNGSGYGGSTLPDDGASCSSYIPPTWNGQTYSTGTEVSLWIWNQYLQTRNLAFLQAGYPLMKASAQFLLSQATLGSDGLLHTQANAHETQWFVTDPVTDILSMDALFPAVVSAAQILNTDQSFVTQLTTAEAKIPPLPRTDAATHKLVLTASADAGGNDVIAYSTQPYATLRNNENLDLQALWPYNVVSDTSSLLPLFVRTYNNRLWVNMGDWDDSPIQAARLGLSSEVQHTLQQNILNYQVYPDGLANLWGFGGPATQPYNEQLGIITTALNEALVQDYDGTLRIAPAWPSGWTASGVVAIQNNSKVDVQYENGTPVTVVLEAGATASQTVRSPWSGQSVEVIDATSSTMVVSPTTGSTFSVPMTSGHKYLIEKASAPFTSLSYAQVTGTPASSPRQLTGLVTDNVGGPVSPPLWFAVGIGIPYSNLANAFNNVGVTADSNTNAGNLDGNGNSFSASALAATGASPGTMKTVGGITFMWPRTSGSGAPDNVVSNGQLINLNGWATTTPTIPATVSATTLGFLLSSDYGATSGSGTVTYTDGSTVPFTLPVPDWWDSSGPHLVFNPTYLNSPGNTTTNQPVAVYFAGVTLDPTKGVESVSLPSVSATATPGVPALHIFSMGLQYANLASAFNNAGVTSNTSTSAGNYDGSGNSFSEAALENAGAPRPGNTVTVSGVQFQWPASEGTGAPDNVVAAGQVIAVYAQGSTLGFLLSSDYGSSTGSGTITYTDGSTSSFTLTAPDWWAGASAGTVAFAPSYLNGAANTSANQQVDVYYVGVPLNTSKTVATVQLPNVSTAAVAGSPALHIFSIGIR